MPIIDLLLLAILAGVAWCVAAEGPWGAALTLLSVVFAGLLAMNYFEPLAAFLETNWPGWKYRWDMFALLGLFTAFVFGLRLAGEQIMPTYIQVPLALHEVARWGCAAATGYVTMAILLTALHTAPLPREFWGFTPERNNLFSIAAPDRQWLGFTQYVSEHSLAKRAKVQLENDKVYLGHVFDAPAILVGDASNPYPNFYWPSFPIRYATRRETLSSSAGAAPPPPPPPQPQSGGGSGPAPVF